MFIDYKHVKALRSKYKALDRKVMAQMYAKVSDRGLIGDYLQDEGGYHRMTVPIGDVREGDWLEDGTEVVAVVEERKGNKIFIRLYVQPPNKGSEKQRPEKPENLNEAKRVLDIELDDHSEDWKILLYLEWITDFLKEVCNRDFDFKSRVQYYQGTGTQKLLLRCRPVFPAPMLPYSSIQIIYDSNGYFGAGSGAFIVPDAIMLVYGRDYTLKIDQDNGSSRSGILYRIGEYWNKPQVRQAGLLSPFLGPDTGSYQVTYTAGYTIDTMPGILRMATNALLAKFRWFFPLGLAISSDSFQEKSISASEDRNGYFLNVIRPFINSLRNWSYGGTN